MGGRSPHSDSVAHCGDDAGHGGTVVVQWMHYLVGAAAVVVLLGGHVLQRGGVEVLGPVVHDADVDVVDQVAAGPDGFHVYVPVGSVGELVLFFRCHWHPLRASSIPGLLSILAHCSTIHLKAVFLVASDGVLAGAGVSFDLEVVGPGREQVFDGTAVVSGQLLQVVSDDGLSGSIQQFSIYLQ